MRQRRAVWFLSVFASFNVALALATGLGASACGSRTGLLIGAVAEDEAETGVRRDSGRDALVDREPDVPQGIDVTPIDAQRIDCVDAGQTLIYVVQNTTELYSFDPPTATFTFIGNLACPDPNGSTPFSMAVDRKGIAYVLYASGPTGAAGNLFRVSTATAACTPTKYIAGSTPGFTSFGMGFASDDNGKGETLYVASDDTAGGELGAIDVASFALRDIGPFNPAVLSGELTGTGDGRLYTFYTPSGVHNAGEGSAISEVDKSTGKVLGTVNLPTVEQGAGWAFAFWGGDFYLFTSPGGPSTVTRYRPSDGSVTVVATAPGEITGAGVSTCAPSQ